MTFRSVFVTRSYEQVVDQLLERIHSGAFAPSERLPTERELGELFGVSRGVIREAIKVLGTLGVVESRQGSGTYVSANLVPSVSRALVLSAKPEERSILDLMEFRAPLERLAARLAAERRNEAEVAEIAEAAAETRMSGKLGSWDLFSNADNRFHSAIYSASRNPFIVTVLGSVREIQANTVAMVVSTSGSIDIAAGHHERIAAAIAAADGQQAEELMVEHIAYSIEALKTRLGVPQDDRERLNLRWPSFPSNDGDESR
ncbi:MAG: FadR/GntR family transcriptional regulator [Thermomicrobiales bacterium]